MGSKKKERKMYTKGQRVITPVGPGEVDSVDGFHVMVIMDEALGRPRATVYGWHEQELQPERICPNCGTRPAPFEKGALCDECQPPRDSVFEEDGDEADEALSWLQRAAQRVIDSWATGDLAGAVNELEAALEDSLIDSTTA